MVEEYLVLVDKNDNPIGSEEKVKCHLPNGKLHRAFTILLFKEDSTLLLTKRSQSKMVWPGDWDGTVASHPRESETYVASSERRLPEEVGLSCKLDYLFKFEYHVPYKDIGSENEICGTLLGIVENQSAINFVKEEISEIKWVTSEQLATELMKNPQNFCPWMIIALYLLSSSKEAVLTKHRLILSDWIKPETKNILEKSIRYHFPDDNWRLINK